ncbi:MAG: CHAT domain-containing protein [Cyanobacteria bacterium P01_C01_bin.72]
MKAQALLNLGNVLSRLGEYELAAQSLAQGLTIAQQRQEKDLVVEILLSLGNNAQFEEKTTAALAFYQRAIATDADADLQLRAKLDRLDVFISSSQIVAANREAQEISQLLKELPPGQTIIQAKVSLARNLLELERPPMTISHLLLEAVREVQALKISRLEADALGILGSLYEQNQHAAAEPITEKALLIAQSVDARELTYQWQWQLGRILVAQGKTEQAIVANLVPSEVLLNQNFTRDGLQQKIATLPYPVVHLATHGQFSSRAEDTYLLTWNDCVNVKNLDYLLQNRDFNQQTPIELLILSAFQTAAGDNNAALGLAGVAIRSGARSTVATLWSIQDDSTAELITQFYQALTSPGTSKAEALRQAQLSLLRSPKYSHPYYWSAFVLVGNWL